VTSRLLMPVILRPTGPRRCSWRTALVSRATKNLTPEALAHPPKRPTRRRGLQSRGNYGQILPRAAYEQGTEACDGGPHFVRMTIVNKPPAYACHPEEDRPTPL
jgi:hypothetical protein